MEEQLLSLPQQFAWEPQYEGGRAPVSAQRFIVCGMGGSHLAASLLLRHDPSLSLSIHRDYGLPFIPENERSETLIVLSSYSGNTEEVLDSMETALREGLPMVALTTGGALAERAQAERIPLILLPQTDAEPRGAFGYSLMALAAVVGGAPLVEEVRAAASALQPEASRELGTEVGGALEGRIPLFYASTSNEIVARMMKIFLNESAKVPAFFYPIPEMSHNELSGFDTNDATAELTERFLAVFLEDAEDHPRVKRRMEITRDLLNEHGVDTLAVPLAGSSALARALAGVALGVFAALHLAHASGVDDAKTPLIAEFKKRMADV